MKGQRRKFSCQQTTCLTAAAISEPYREDPNSLKSRSMLQSRIQTSTKGKRKSRELHRPTKQRQQFEMLEEEFLPHNMIMEILLRLPVKSLLQFKCVCKSWKTLISDPQFAKDHLRYSTADTSTKHLRLAFSNNNNADIVLLPVKPFFDNNKSSTPLPRTPPKPIRVKMTGAEKLILGSCNGLLCLFDYRKSFVTLWNPSTRFMSKTSIHIYENRESSRIMSAGFGYDQVNDKYKLILMLQFGVPTQKVIKIYTFGATNNSSATTICNLPPPNTTVIFGKFVSGTLNWIVTGGLECDLSKYKWTIFWFDLEKETYHEMLLPEQHTLKPPALGVLNNCLCVSFFDSYQTHWVVWSMKKHGVADSWTKIITISPLNIYGCGLNLLYISKSGNLLGRCPYLFLYDSINGRFEYNLMNGIDCGYAPQIYHESLISPLC